MAKRSKQSEVPDSSVGPFNSPFSGLAGKSAPVARPEPTPSSAQLAQPLASGATAPFAGKLVLRRTRKAHGGKTVTMLQGLRVEAQERTTLARELGKALGCGARAEGNDICLAGDQCDRLEAWLRGRGATRIVLGGG